MSHPTFSVVINTYNRVHTLPATIESLRQLRYPNFEIVVVCGPSTDGTQEWLEEHAQDCKVAFVDEANLSISRNVGIVHATGEYIAYIDDDALPEPNWLNELAAAFEDSSVVAAGGYVHDHTGFTYQARSIISNRFGKSNIQADQSGDRPWKPGAHEFIGLMGVNTAFRRTALVEVGGFDETYIYYLDETDVLLRLMDNGGQIAVRPLALVHHKYASSHLRDEKKAPKPGTYRTVIRSETYYILQANRNIHPLKQNLKQVQIHRDEWKYFAYADHYSSGRIDEEGLKALQQEVNDGIEQGIQAAFKYPQRATKYPEELAPQSDFKKIELKIPQSRRLRLAFISPDCPPGVIGGVGVFIYQLARELAARGHEISLFTQSENKHHTVDQQDGIWVHRIPLAGDVEIYADLPPMPGPLARHTSNILAEIQRVLPIRQFDYAIGSIWDLDMAALIASDLLPVGLYLVSTYKHVMDHKPEWTPGTNFYDNHVLPMVEAEKWALRSDVDIIASTHAIADDVEKLYGVQIQDRAFIEPFGIEGCRTTNKRQDNDDNLQILYLGRLEPRKGIDLLLDTAPSLLENNKKLEIHVVGQDHGNYVEQFNAAHRDQKWHDRIIFHGPVNDDALHQAYANCDIFVAPSRFESFGLIYLEAMRYEKPCVGIKAGGVPEIVINGETGLLIENDNAQQLQAALQKLLDDPEMRSSMGIKGRERYEIKFSVASYADRMEKFVWKRIES